MTSANRLLIAAALIAVFFNGAIIVDVLTNQNEALFAEGEFVEDISSFSFLTAALALFASSFYHQGITRFLQASLGTLNLMLFLREVDVGDLNIPFPIKQITSNDLKDGLFVVIFLTLGIVFLCKYRKRIKEVCSYFLNRVGALLIGGGVLFLIAGPLEEFDFHFAEELIESNGAYCFLLASFFFIFKEAPSEA